MPTRAIGDSRLAGGSSFPVSPSVASVPLYITIINSVGPQGGWGGVQFLILFLFLSVNPMRSGCYKTLPHARSDGKDHNLSEP